MRNAALVAVIALASVALDARAEKFGPVDVVALTRMGGDATSGYAEDRFQITNHDRDGHFVTLTIVSHSYRPVLRRVSHTFAVPARGSMPVAIEEPIWYEESSRQLVVSIDGRQQQQDVRLPSTRSGERTPQLLMTRSFPDVNLRTAFAPAPPPRTAVIPGMPVPVGPSTIPYRFVRAEVGPSEWSTSWLAYTPYNGILATSSDWIELPAAARTAILRRVRAGGSLFIVGDSRVIPEVTFNTIAGPFNSGELGFGTVFHGDTLDQPMKVGTAEPLRRTWDRFLDPSYAPPPLDSMPMLSGQRVPVGALFTSLIAFAILAGPVTLIVLARNNKRLWIFWVVPLLALITSATIIVASLSAEGWQRASRSTSVTLLDENSGESTTFGIVGFYATLPPDNLISFSPDTAIQPLMRWYDTTSETDLTNGQRLVSGWVRSRVSTYFAFIKNERRRERLPIRVNGDSLVAMNGLGTEIKKLWVATPTGAVYEATDVAPGAHATLRRTNKTAEPTASVKDLLPGVETWPTYPARFSADPRTALRPGTYIAIVSDSPFPDHPLEHARRSLSQGAVIGILKRADSAS